MNRHTCIKMRWRPGFLESLGIPRYTSHFGAAVWLVLFGEASLVLFIWDMHKCRWPVHQVHIDVVQPEVKQRFFEHRLHVLFAMVRVVQFGRDEELFAGNHTVLYALGDGVPNLILVEIVRGCVNHPTPHPDPHFCGFVQSPSLCLCVVARSSERAHPDHRHFVTICKRDVRHRCWCWCDFDRAAVDLLESRGVTNVWERICPGSKHPCSLNHSTQPSHERIHVLQQIICRMQSPCSAGVRRQHCECIDQSSTFDHQDLFHFLSLSHFHFHLISEGIEVKASKAGLKDLGLPPAWCSLLIGI
eukprot:m.26338 g.26338  ORF g.26338 m.26338 type:complete len:302 (-) comp11727_c0_seq1:448-1353(-)